MKPYLSRIFQGRLNRQNYTTGSLLLLLVPFLCLLSLSGSVLSSPSARDVLLINPYDPAQLEIAASEEATLQSTVNEVQTSPVNKTILSILLLYMIATIPLILSFQIRRLHDLNKSGWWMLLSFIPFVSYFFPLYVAFASGTVGENKYGIQPLARTNLLKDILKL